MFVLIFFSNSFHADNSIKINPKLMLRCFNLMVNALLITFHIVNGLISSHPFLRCKDTNLFLFGKINFNG